MAEPPRSPAPEDDPDLLAAIRAQRTGLRPQLTARLFAAEAAHAARWSLRLRPYLLIAAALLVTAPLLVLLLQPRPAPVLLRLDADADQYISQAEVDAQLQRLATALCAVLPGGQRAGGVAAASSTAEIARIAHALAATGRAGNGGAFGPDLRTAAGWLEQQLPDLHGSELATALAALSVVAAETGDAVAALRAHGARLVDEGLQEAHGGRLWPQAPAPALAECGRLLALAPAFGIDAAPAAQLRRHLAVELERRTRDGGAGPDLLAAQLYGFGDLLDCADAERQLRQWRPTALTAGDLTTMQQVVASIESGEADWRRFRLGLRRLAICQVPTAAAAQADMLLCLAASSLTNRGLRFSQAVAFAQRSL